MKLFPGIHTGNLGSGIGSKMWSTGINLDTVVVVVETEIRMGYCRKNIQKICERIGFPR
jgi:hypothetical protein